MVATIIRPTVDELREWTIPQLQYTIDAIEAEIAEPEAYLKTLKEVRNEKGLRYHAEHCPMGVTSFEMGEHIYIVKPKTKVEMNLLQDLYPEVYRETVQKNARLISCSTDNEIKVMESMHLDSVLQREILGRICKPMKPSIVAQPRKVC